ncbi:MAG: hypothetical protein R3F55_22105 [Alphaproteobacteria bacterium]
MQGQTATREHEGAAERPSVAQLRWLQRGLDQPSGKLPLFDRDGRRVNGRMVRACLDAGWAEPWFNNPLKPTWLVCKLTPHGRRLALAAG